MTVKVLFSNPPWWAGREGKFLKRWSRGVRAGSRWPFTYTAHSSPGRRSIFKDYVPYPFFMGYATTYLARALGSAGSVVLRDSIAMAETYDDYFDFVKQGRFDYIFIESATPSWDHDREIIERIREISEAKIVITGPIAANAKAILESGIAHACIHGEYEKGAVSVVVDGKSGDIPTSLLTKEEMNAAPLPYFDDIIAHRYWDACPIGQKYPQLQIWSSRGCPYKCIFCVWPASMTGNDPDGTGKRTVRHYTPAYIENMLTELVGRYKFKSIYFDDDTFNLGNSHVLKMCEVLKRVGLPWSAMCRADTSKMESWKVMRDAGCFGVKLGFESGNQWVVDNIVNKHLDLEYAKQAVLEIKKLGMKVHGTFTYGLPGENARAANGYQKVHPVAAVRHGAGIGNRRDRGHADGDAAGKRASGCLFGRADRPAI